MFFWGEKLIQLCPCESLDKAWKVLLGVEMGESQVGKIIVSLWCTDRKLTILHSKAKEQLEVSFSKWP